MLEPKVGERIGGRYLLVERLGAGGMGEVWLAVLEGSGTFRRKVVVKFVPSEKSDDDRLAAMLADEARILGLLFHPGIVAPVDYVEGPDGQVLVLEYVDGPSLRTALRLARRNRCLLPEALAAWVGAEVARALHAAHLATDEAGQPLGLIHRDVSPDNVLISRDGRVHLADFGVARALGNSDVTMPGAAPKGKRGYMPPEQAAGQPLGPSADVFALGRVVAEAADVNCGVRLRQVLDKATAPNATDRFQTGAELAAALGDVCPPPADPAGALSDWLLKACAELFAPATTAAGTGPIASLPPHARGPHRFHLKFQTDPGLKPGSEPPPAPQLFAGVADAPRPRGLRIIAGALALVAVGLPLTLFAENRILETGSLLPALQGLRAPRGLLEVRSRPEAAEVYVDGALRGATPLRLEIAEGKHAVRVGSLRLEKWRGTEIVVRASVTERVDVDLTE